MEPAGVGGAVAERTCRAVLGRGADARGQSAGCGEVHRASTVPRRGHVRGNLLGLRLRDGGLVIRVARGRKAKQIRLRDGKAFDPARSGLKVAVPAGASRPRAWTRVESLDATFFARQLPGPTRDGILGGEQVLPRPRPRKHDQLSDRRISATSGRGSCVSATTGAMASTPTLSKMQSVRFASGAAIGYSPIPWPAPTPAHGSIHLSSVPRPTDLNPTPTCVTCSPSCPRRNPSPRSKPCCRPVSTPPPWPETHSKGCSPPHVNNALCGALTERPSKKLSGRHLNPSC